MEPVLKSSSESWSVECIVQFGMLLVCAVVCMVWSQKHVAILIILKHLILLSSRLVACIKLDINVMAIQANV